LGLFALDFALFARKLRVLDLLGLDGGSTPSDRPKARVSASKRNFSPPICRFFQLVFEKSSFSSWIVLHPTFLRFSVVLTFPDLFPALSPFFPDLSENRELPRLSFSVFPQVQIRLTFVRVFVTFKRKTQFSA
jgi:hypothetical protein